jgi:ATP-binding cassette subfamily B protein
LIYRQIIDGGIEKHDSHLIVLLALLLAALALADALLSLAQRYISSRVGEGLIYDMREKVFGHIQEMPLAFFSRTQTGALISRLNNDVLGAQQAFTDTLSSIVSNFITVILTVAVMAFLSWQITVVALLLLPMFVFPARRIGRKLQQLTREAYNLNAQMTNTMTERFNVSGALLVKLFGRPDIEHGEFAGRAARVRDIGVQTAMYGRVFFLSLILTSSLATALVYGWGGVLAADGRFKVGTVVALAALLVRLYGPLTALSNVNVDVMTALVSFDRVFEVLDLAPLIGEKPDAVAIPRGPVAVEFDHVDFSYPTAEEVSLASLESVAVLDQTPSSEVLHDVSFRAEPGQLVALVGPSGAGKTTISYLVSRLYDVRDGAVRLNGLDVRDATFESLRESIGVVTQDAHLFHETIRANLLYAKPDATEEEIHDAIEGAQILSFVESLPEGLDTVVGDRGYRLSGGEKQRIALARLLLKAPDVVVLDEATAHLDSESEAAVQRALQKALEARTSIVIAHRLSTVRGADQLLVVVDGRIVERGRHDELLAAGGVYADLYRTQFEHQALEETAVVAT